MFCRYDHESWYPLGRPVGTTIYPGMQITSVRKYQQKYARAVIAAEVDVRAVVGKEWEWLRKL